MPPFTNRDVRETVQDVLSVAFGSVERLTLPQRDQVRELAKLLKTELNSATNDAQTLSALIRATRLASHVARLLGQPAPGTEPYSADERERDRHDFQLS